MMIAADSPLGAAVVAAIRGGDVAAIGRLLDDHPDLATAKLCSDGEERTMLHLVTDWPGHFPNGAAMVAMLVAAGADVNARFVGPHTETPLHWAASSDDVEVLDALLDAGADIDARGAVIAGGTPLTDARAFGKWRAARRLVERGARVWLDDAAALGLLDRIEALLPEAAPAEIVDSAFWNACHGGQRAAAEKLLRRGAAINWVPPWEPRTPLDAAVRSRAAALVDWLRARGAKTFAASKT